MAPWLRTWLYAPLFACVIQGCFASRLFADRLRHVAHATILPLPLAAQTAAMEKPQRLMQMYASRANARWVEEFTAGGVATQTLLLSSTATAAAAAAASAMSDKGGGDRDRGPGSGMGAGDKGGWDPPNVFEAARFAATVGGAQSAVFKKEVVTALRAGRMAVQVRRLAGRRLPGKWGARGCHGIARSLRAAVAVHRYVSFITHAVLWGLGARNGFQRATCCPGYGTIQRSPCFAPVSWHCHPPLCCPPKPIANTINSPGYTLAAPAASSLPSPGAGGRRPRHHGRRHGLRPVERRPMGPHRRDVPRTGASANWGPAASYPTQEFHSSVNFA